MDFFKDIYKVLGNEGLLLASVGLLALIFAAVLFIPSYSRRFRSAAEKFVVALHSETFETAKVNDALSEFPDEFLERWNVYKAAGKPAAVGEYLIKEKITEEPLHKSFARGVAVLAIATVLISAFAKAVQSGTDFALSMDILLTPVLTLLGGAIFIILLRVAARHRRAKTLNAYYKLMQAMSYNMPRLSGHGAAANEKKPSAPPAAPAPKTAPTPTPKSAEEEIKRIDEEMKGKKDAAPSAADETYDARKAAQYATKYASSAPPAAAPPQPTAAARPTASPPPVNAAPPAAAPPVVNVAPPAAAPPQPTAAPFTPQPAFTPSAVLPPIKPLKEEADEIPPVSDGPYREDLMARVDRALQSDADSKSILAAVTELLDEERAKAENQTAERQITLNNALVHLVKSISGKKTDGV